jgi:hypothetical protein
LRSPIALTDRAITPIAHAPIAPTDHVIAPNDRAIAPNAMAVSIQLHRG